MRRLSSINPKPKALKTLRYYPFPSPAQSCSCEPKHTSSGQWALWVSVGLQCIKLYSTIDKEQAQKKPLLSLSFHFSNYLKDKKDFLFRRRGKRKSKTKDLCLFLIRGSKVFAVIIMFISIINRKIERFYKFLLADAKIASSFWRKNYN